MRVVVHYTGAVQYGTFVALAQERLAHRTNMPPHRPAPSLMRVIARHCPADDPHAYGDSLAWLWAGGESFINLEGDVAPWPGALRQMWECPEPWCAMPIIVHDAVNDTNLGCVKFSAKFIADHPDLWSSYPRNAVFDWRSLDSWLWSQLRPRTHHRHLPPALHLNKIHILEGLAGLEDVAKAAMNGSPHD